MSTTPFVDFRALPASRALHWLAQGARLWRRAPVMLLVLGFAPLFVEGIVQFIPVVGMVLSKFVTPLFGFGLVIGLDVLARGGRLRASHLFAAFRDGRLPAAARLALWTMLVPAFQFAVATIVYGPAALDAVVLGHLREHPELMTRAFSFWLILPGLPLATLLTFAPPLVFLAGVSPARAIVLSARRVLAAPLPFAVLLLATVGVLAAALSGSWWGMLALLLLPWLMAPGFAAWLDLSGNDDILPVPMKAFATE